MKLDGWAQSEFVVVGLEEGQITPYSASTSNNTDTNDDSPKEIAFKKAQQFCGRCPICNNFRQRFIISKDFSWQFRILFPLNLR